MAMTLAEAWRGAIAAADYEEHMRAAGQAQANAGLVDRFLREAPPGADSAILVAGAGTGQMFDYLERAALYPFRTTFTDINPAFLERLAERVGGDPRLRFETVLDDVEASGLKGGFALAIAVLVLEHVDWRKAVATLCRVASRVFVVIQENAGGAAHVRVPVGSVAVLLEAHPHEVPRSDLERAFTAAGFAAVRDVAAAVADGKRMIAIEFAARAAGEVP